jgi:hypothetical protein
VPVSMGSYFVSEEAENAAINNVIRTFKAAKEAKAALEGQMSALGEKLSLLAAVLRSPSEYPFRVGLTDLTVGQPRQEGAAPRRPFVSLDASDLDWQRIREMFMNYDKAREDKRESMARLKNMGLDIAE